MLLSAAAKSQSDDAPSFSLASGCALNSSSERQTLVVFVVQYVRPHTARQASGRLYEP